MLVDDAILAKAIKDVGDTFRRTSGDRCGRDGGKEQTFTVEVDDPVVDHLRVSYWQRSSGPFCRLAGAKGDAGGGSVKVRRSGGNDTGM